MTNIINKHIPVLLKETVDLLNVKSTGVYVDTTSGMGGHSAEILKHLTTGKLICIDQDSFAIEQLNNRFKDKKNVIIVKSNFSKIQEVLNSLGITKVDGIISDLGVSSPMFDDFERGFSYKGETKLDMRMDQDQSFDAWQVVNKYSESQLIKIFKDYGEAKEAKKVAKAIVMHRLNSPIDTTSQLVEIIKNSVSKQTLNKVKHPARTYFQAIRIEVNDELNNLQNFINTAVKHLNHDGRLAIISYHSLEDRIIKNTFNKLVTSNIPIEVPITNEKINYELINKHPIIPSDEELMNNHRSRSAKLRGIRYIGQ